MKCEVRDMKCEMRSARYEMRDAEYEMRNAKCEVRCTVSYESAKLRKRRSIAELDYR